MKTCPKFLYEFIKLNKYITFINQEYQGKVQEFREETVKKQKMKVFKEDVTLKLRSQNLRLNQNEPDRNQRKCKQ